ncbi:MAG: fibrobacter succinogenes major paralogous domain-containing protein [Candidatus Nomurabacteria bacterium]|jgi:uncharacterized protein (TIGR02145 family)|nr:fibrobacter succinogenes major paralogous domain-containing protein [Candidatus Nomurabacteria bacterium]
MNATQTININIFNTPNTPNTGAWLGDAASNTAVATISNLVVAAATILAAALLALALTFVFKKRKAAAKVVFSLLLVPVVTLLFAVAHDSAAASSLALDHATLNVNIFKNGTSGTLAQSTTSTTTVTTSNPAGHKLSARLASLPSNNIAVKLSGKSLTTVDTDIYNDNTGTSPNTSHNNLEITVPADIPVGTYSFKMIYSITDNVIKYLSDVTTENHITTMQALTPSVCQAATYDNTNNGINDHNTVKLTDTRNSQDYRVRKLPDGKCWMIDNMKLANHTLTSADSNVAADFTIPVKPVQSKAMHNNGECYPDADGTNIGTIDNTNRHDGFGLLTCTGSNYPINNGIYNFAAYSDPEDATSNPHYAFCEPGIPSLDPGSTTRCGYLYNWFTATAGTGVASLDYGDQASSSICPVNWRLPSAGDGNWSSVNNEFSQLNIVMFGNPSLTTSGNYTDKAHAANWLSKGPFAGVYSGSYELSLSGQGDNGVYWSSTAYSDTSGNHLYIDSDQVFPSEDIMSTGGKPNGLAVRCVL